MKGVQCQKCGGFGRLEPGGYCCINCGYAPIHRRILPANWNPDVDPFEDDDPEELRARDERNRIRQEALDLAKMSPGGAPAIVQRMLEKLEGCR